MNPFRNGNKNFYGPGSQFTIDTTKPLKVITQFITADNTDTGELKYIRRFYVQNGKKVQFPQTNVSGLPPYDSITTQNCASQKKVFG